MTLLQQEGYEMMGAAFEVYNVLGFGMAEQVCQQSLEIEFKLRRIPFQSQAALKMHYKGRELIARYTPDLMVFEEIVVELKAVGELNSIHEAQLFNYMRIAGANVGYLLNFGFTDNLEWKRFVISNHRT